MADLISHKNHDDLAEIYAQAKTRIENQEFDSVTSIAEQIKILDDLMESEIGRFLLSNKGLNGFWIDILLNYHDRKDEYDKKYNVNEITHFILNHAPVCIATQERHKIFLEQNQLRVKNNAHLCCVPSGLSGEILNLDYSNIENIKLTSIDLDEESLGLSKARAKEKNLLHIFNTRLEDAWDLSDQKEFDLISCNGLTIYETKDDRVGDLYQKFFDALKDDGVLVTSYITPSPKTSENSEWDFSQINKKHLLMQKLALADIAQTSWLGHRSTDKTKELLKKAGFRSFEIKFDSAKLFPTIIASK